MAAGTGMAGAGCDGVREEPACTAFREESDPLSPQSSASPSAEHIFLLILFRKGRVEAGAVCGEARIPLRVSKMRAFSALRPGDPALRALGEPGAERLPGWERQRALPGVLAGGFSQPPTGPSSPEAQLPARPSGPRARGRLDGSPCRSALPPTLHPAAED